MGFSVTRQNFTHNNNVNLGGLTPDITYDQCLFLNLVEDFIHNGFTIYDSEVVDQYGNTSRPTKPSDAISSVPITDLQLGTVSVILIPDNTVDPLIADNPWFVKLTTLDGSNDTNFVSSATINATTESSPEKGQWWQSETSKRAVSITKQEPNMIKGYDGRGNPIYDTKLTGTYVDITIGQKTETLKTASVVTHNTVTGVDTITSYYYTGLSIGVGYYTSVEMPKIGSQSESITSMSKILPPLKGIKNDFSPRMYSSNPYGYTLTIVKRGFALNIYPQDSTEDLQESGFYVVQRAMSCGGSMNSSGNQPLYMITNITPISLNSKSDTTAGIDSIIGPQATWFARIIREHDVTTSYPEWSASSSNYFSTSYGSTGMDYVLLNTNISDTRELLGNVLHRFPDRWQAPVTRDTGEYVLLFPFGICSNRYAYTDELDLIAVSKANAYQASQLVPVSVYKESRSYRAGSSNNKQVGNDSGIRVFLYTVGPEITAPTSYSDVKVKATNTVTTSWGNIQANTGS